MATISFFRTGAGTDEQQIVLSSEPSLPSVPQTISFQPSGIFVAGSILTAARTLATFSSTSAPTPGGSLQINGQSCGNFEYRVAGTTTISSFTASDWFSSTEDTVSSWILINGNLTIDLGQTFIPSVRKLFTVIYVSGNLTVNGVISMTARGANHSGTGNSGGYTEPVDIRLVTGTVDTVVNPQIPATGGAGGNGRSTTGQNSGGAGTNGGTGGGGGGYWFTTGMTSGSGRAGTCFSGGSGGGSSYGTNPPNSTSAITNGGAAGNAGGASGGGGAGNPPGTGLPSPTYDGVAGTGGVLIIICQGALSGNGSIEAKGSSGGSAGGVSGGGSGGGSLNIFYGTNPSPVVATSAAGGITGAGGTGTSRRLALGSN